MGLSAESILFRRTDLRDLPSPAWEFPEKRLADARKAKHPWMPCFF